MSPLKHLVLVPHFPMYAAFPHSEYYLGIRHPPQRLPYCEWSTRLAYSALTKAAMDLPGSPDASVATHAAPLDPAGITGESAFHVFERVGFQSEITKLIRLYLRCDRRVALSTLNLCRYLHVFNTRSPVERLAPCRDGIFTRWKRRSLPGATKYHLRSASYTAIKHRLRFSLMRSSA